MIRTFKTKAGVIVNIEIEITQSQDYYNDSFCDIKIKRGNMLIADNDKIHLHCNKRLLKVGINYGIMSNGGVIEIAFFNGSIVVRQLEFYDLLCDPFEKELLPANL